MAVEEENVLYDLLVHSEWLQESEAQPRRHRQCGSILVKTISGPLKFVLQYVRYSHSSSLLSPSFVQLVDKQINWQLVVASNGKLLAVVQDQCIEIRSARDEFGSVFGKCLVPKDPHPQWRHVTWSHDCTLLAYADSSGTVKVFDLMGSELFVIPQTINSAGDLSYAVAGLIFLESTDNAQCSTELLVINYRGQLKSYWLSVGTQQSYQESHSFNFNSHYSHGVITVIYHSGHKLLLVGGCETSEEGISKASSYGVTAWRVLSGAPYYKQVTNYEDDVAGSQRGLLKLLSFRGLWRQEPKQDGVFKMSLSPDGTILAVIHLSGQLTLWELPSLRHQKEWKQEMQVGYDAINPEWTKFMEKRKKIKDRSSFYPLCDINWWSDSAVILARCSGALTVSSVRTLKNLLGQSCEWFEPSPQVGAAHNGSFMCLECEVKVAYKRHRLETNTLEDDEGDEESDSDDESSARARYFSYVKQGLYYLTEMERFAPPRKRPRTISKTYRLVSLRSTTPEELYQRKIDNEEYGEALALAMAYDLDSDLVYQRQWRKSPVNLASIQDYLSKIKKRSWVLHECVERVPENVDAARELLQYGLKGTDLEALIAVGKGEDGGRFILPGDVDIDDLPYEDYMSPVEEMQKRKEKEAARRQELLQCVNFSMLTLEQKELCRCRLKLLTYLNRLATYEEILGGPHAAERRYDSEFFKKFRSQNIVLSARTYARESNVQALEILFTYHGSDLLPHRLAILSNFPETTTPHEYCFLLPEARFVDEQGDLVVLPWNEQRHQDLDWCEEPNLRQVIDCSPQDVAEFLYQEQPELLKYSTTEPSIECLTEWYQKRAEEIESYSRQVDCALSLVRLGKERNIPGLEVLCDDLITLETLVYEAGADPTLSLKELQQMKDIDKLRQLMINSSEEMYIKNVYQWVVPFLHRCESKNTGHADELLREYLVTEAKEDLKYPLKIFQQSKPDCQQKIIPDHHQLMAVALECLYNCERDDQLALCYDILECLPQRGFGPETEMSKTLHDQVDLLEQHLSVAEILEKHGLQKPISFVKNTQSSSEEARLLMVRLTRHVGRKNPPVSESEWRGLFHDLLEMQRSVYSCLDFNICCEIFTESLLCSNRLENIRLAGQMMHCNSVSVDPSINATSRSKIQSKVNYEKSIELVLTAAREYFNSSATLTDNCMDLARCCLQLITDCPPVIQEELDLISALNVMEEFNMKILPMQVRMCSDRLRLIKECITQCPTAYKQSKKLLILADLLRVAGQDKAQRKGEVLVLLAEQALEYEDYKASSIHCQDLMSAGYSAGWQVCSKLGQSDGYHDLTTRQELMSFARTYCPPNVIQSLLAVSSSLQTQILYQAVNYQIEPSERSESINSTGNAQQIEIKVSNNSSDLLHRTTAKTMEVLSSTSMTTKAVLHAVSDAQWWKKSLSYLRPLHDQGREATLRRETGVNGDLEKQGCHPFYEILIDDPFIDKSEVNYTSYQYSALENFAEVLLRAGKLSETKSEGENLFPATEVLLQLASDALPKDMTLALAYLLALPQIVDATKCFEKQPHSALSLQFAGYYYALQIYIRLSPCFKEKCHSIYRADPKEVINLVTKHVTENTEFSWPEEIQALIHQLCYYNELLTDFTQAQTLQGLGKGVDVQRFATDSQYKRETILGLAETLEENVYKISLSLAQRYNIALWEVYMTHLEFLFTDSGLSTSEIESRVRNLDLFDVLKTNQEAFHEHMTKYVYPGIDGVDHVRLLYYFTLLENCGCAEFVKKPIKPDTNIKLLKKLKVVTPDLNYKKLTDGDADPLESLEPVLNSHNVLPVSKLAPKIPGKGGTMLSANLIYATWLRKLFWIGDIQLIKKPPQEEAEWLHAYDTCAKYFDRLLPEDVIGLIDDFTFSENSVNKLHVQARLEITKRAMKAIKQVSEKQQKKAFEGNIPPASNSQVSYEEALTHLQQSFAHLETLNHSFVHSLKANKQVLFQKYYRLYDLSRSESSKLHNLVVTMVLDGQPLDIMQQMLLVAVESQDISAKAVVQDAIQRVINVLSGTSTDVLPEKDPLQVLEGIVKSVHSNVVDGGNLVSSDDLLTWLRPFCSDADLPVKPRIYVLQVLEQAFDLSDEDSKLLVLFRTQAVLKACWPEKQVNVNDIANEEKRFQLFLELLDSSNDGTKFQHLVMLLQAWPPMNNDDMSTEEHNAWIKLVTAMLVKCAPEKQDTTGNEILSICRSLYLTKHKLPFKWVKQIYLLLLEQSILLPALKLGIESGNHELQKLVMEQIRAVSQIDASNCDTELLSLLLNNKLVVDCVSTVFYPYLLKHLLANHEEGQYTVEEIAEQLNEAGCTAEGGSLLMYHRATHPSLSTFSAALSVTKRWL
ncbi:NBAS subunit of NRZ tethering complex isoform X1 [Hemiscyllium ocellatum]|uniref:NBAS subunit of NRZ tethering complex isoform X1 n=2 Tax=Hemiscyllium ocellatum TaxID=170820 RepID=UPI00296640A2|nr:NBAS subunit of NRZ tethering complex isoform X1 [Hemiscyllium ocellatum]